MKNHVLLIFSLLAVNSLLSQVPTGQTATYPLDGDAVDKGASVFTGTMSPSFGLGTTNRFGTANKAIALTAALSSGTLPSGLVNAMQTDFSIGFWFKTAMIAPTGPQWYNGSSLVDAEVAGVTNDWGITLIDGGKVCFGVGNPDVTIKSTSNYNNNAWHFVSASRKQSSGAMVLYVDGVSVATGTGGTGLLNAPSVIGLGRSSAVAMGSYTGSLDDMMTYNRVLTGTEVSQAYTALGAFALPLRWVSFDAEVISNAVVLNWQVAEVSNNDRFEIEHSVDGQLFEKIGTVADSRGPIAATIDYHFAAPLPSGKLHYYRVRQVDKDDRSSYSKTVRVSIASVSASFRLQANPVVGDLVILNPAQELIHRIVIADAGGRVIQSITVESGTNTVRIPSASLKSGIYAVRIFSASGSSTLSMLKR
jgi:Concanavalin A-like lectin/glucanases superfamily